MLLLCELFLSFEGFSFLFSVSDNPNHIGIPGHRLCDTHFSRLSEVMRVLREADFLNKANVRFKISSCLRESIAVARTKAEEDPTPLVTGCQAGPTSSAATALVESSLNVGSKQLLRCWGGQPWG